MSIRFEHAVKPSLLRGARDRGDGAPASGERFDMQALAAAHRTLPFGTIVRVANLESNRSVIVRINDRGPFRRDRIIDLSYEAAGGLGIVARGAARAETTVIECR
jgi:rare lipoprotein A